MTINTHFVEHLEANRGAQSSSITADRGLGRLRFGGDVANSTFLSGYPQNLASAISSQSVIPNPSAQSGGFMNVLVAGDVTDSVFAASVEPSDGEFGTPDDLLLPQGQITAKVEGIIDNTVATPAVARFGLLRPERRAGDRPRHPAQRPRAPVLRPEKAPPSAGHRRAQPEAIHRASGGQLASRRSGPPPAGWPATGGGGYRPRHGPSAGADDDCLVPAR